MEKRLLIAIALSALVLGFYYITMEPPVPVVEEESEAERVETDRQEESSYLSVEEVSAPVRAAEGGEDILIETDLYRAVMTTSGARIKSFRLKDYPEMWKEEAEIEKEMGLIVKNLAKTRQAIQKVEGISGRKNRKSEHREKEKALLRSQEALLYVNEDRIKRRGRIGVLEEELREAVAGRDYRKELELREELKSERGVELVPAVSQVYGDYPLTLSFPGLNADLNAASFTCNVDELRLGTGDKSSVEFEAEIDGIKVKKVFTFSQGEYVIGLDVVVENKSREVIGDERGMLVYGPGVALLEEGQVRGVIKRIASYTSGRPKARFESTHKGLTSKATVIPGEPEVRKGDFEWVALRDKYFAVILIPPGECRTIMVENLTEGGNRIGACIPSFSLARGAVSTSDFKLYIGPQKAEELIKAGQSLEKIIDYGFWEPIAKALYFLLKKIFDIVKNYGWAIILLSLLIKIVFYPLTHHSFEGMHKMQEDMKKVQPKMAELKEKYGDNQQKLNKATMELYRREGINPLSGCKSGCFPMLLQMPVFFALYVVLYNSIGLRGAHFVGWITDLASPDPLKVLPILMGVSMFWQQKLTGMGGGAMGAGGAQQDQQKMMKWMMPVFLTFIFFRLPAGVVLYWLSFNIFTGLQQFLIVNKKNKRLAGA